MPPLVAQLDEEDSLINRWRREAIRSGRVPARMKAIFKASLARIQRRTSLATTAFMYLGTNATHAIPELEAIVCDPDGNSASVHAIRILQLLGQPALPALRRSVNNTPDKRKGSIERAIVAIHRDGCKSKDPRIREESVLALGESPYATFDTIFPLVELLGSTHLETRRRALNALARHLPTLGPSLIVAYRAVEKQTDSDDPEMRRVATELLAKLTPPPPGMKP